LSTVVDWPEIDMHVALFVPAWPPERHPNGIITYVRWMREELCRQGHQVSVLASDFQGSEKGVYLVESSPMFRASRWWRARQGTSCSPPFDWGMRCAAALRKVHARHPVDVAEMEESFGWSADVSRITGIPTIVKLHGPAFKALADAELASAFGVARVEREGFALRRAPVITSPAQHTLDETIARYALSPALTRHVVNPLALAPEVPLWNLDRCERKTLLFVGRFDKLKGGDLVLEAFARLLSANRTLKLIFVGPDVGVPSARGDLVPFEEFRAALLSDDAARVEYLGRLAPDEICRLRARAFLTLITSRWENQSYTMLEAMLQGCPIVATDVGGQSETVRHGDTGLLSAPGSVDDLVRQVSTLLQDPQRAARLGAAARAHVQQCHSPARVVSETVAVYERAIALPPCAARRPGLRRTSLEA
jgi:glycosyltransferase involved in cell wall biosynthesis